jgi:hypothetical protein
MTKRNNMDEPKTAVHALLAKVEKKPWPSRAKKYPKKKETPLINKVAFLQGYLAKTAIVDVSNEYNPAATNSGNTCWPTTYVSKAKDPVNPGKDADACGATCNNTMEKHEMEDAPDTAGLAAGKNTPEMPSQITLPFSKKIVNVGQESEGGMSGVVAKQEWPNPNQRSEGKQMNFDQEEKQQNNPNGIDKVNKEDVMPVGEIAEEGNRSVMEVAKELEKGKEVEKEHTDSEKRALNIAKQHEAEFKGGPYYTELAKMEERLREEIRQHFSKTSSIDAANPSDSGTEQTQSDSVHRNTFVENDLTHQSQSLEEETRQAHPHEALNFNKIKQMNGRV